MRGGDGKKGSQREEEVGSGSGSGRGREMEKKDSDLDPKHYWSFHCTAVVAVVVADLPSLFSLNLLLGL
jgi:hypothetical protein